MLLFLVIYLETAVAFRITLFLTFNKEYNEKYKQHK